MKSLYAQTSLPALAMPVKYVPSNEQAAWFAIVHTAANMKGYISEEARETFCKLIACNELFKGHELLNYFYELMEAGDGVPPKEIIRQAAKRVSPEHAPTLFCIVTETLLAKGYLTSQEQELLDFTSQQLSLGVALTNKIVDVLLLKNARKCIYN